MFLKFIVPWTCVMLFWMSPPASAGDFDGTKRLICATGKGMEYHRQGNQRTFNPESAGLPTKFFIFFDLRLILPDQDSVVQRRSKIKRMETIENKLILQGAEDGVEGVDDGVGWTMALNQESGLFVITASGGDLGYIVFGSCLAKVQ